MSADDRWERMITIAHEQSPRTFVDANVVVGDTLYLSWLWWDAKHPEMKVTPADLIAMTRLALEHQRWLAEKEFASER